MDLETLLGLQNELQVEAYGIEPALLQDEELVEYVRVSVLALEDELHEALNEISWKPWAQGFRFNREAWIGELVDALHFLLNLLLVAAPEGGNGGRHDLAIAVGERYQKKRQRNLERQREGYDGVSEKCPQCRRSIDDVTPTIVDGNRHCGGCGCFLERVDTA